MKIPILIITSVALGLSPLAIGAAEEKADNTGRNSGDAQISAEDQSNNEGDLKVTQEIRKAVVADDSLSMMAKNVKIITAGGSVTLRGPVETEAEKEKIGATAKEKAGAMTVRNELEVKK